VSEPAIEQVKAVDQVTTGGIAMLVAIAALGFLVRRASGPICRS